MAKEKSKATQGDDAGGAFADVFAVVAKKSMMRGGRMWTAGVHVFDTKEKLAELGTPEQITKMIETLELYPDDFEVKTAGPAKEPETQS